MKIFITGVNGFVGRSLTLKLMDENYVVRGCIRTGSAIEALSIHELFQKEISVNENWSQAMSDIDVVIHTAARAHVMNETAIDPLREYRSVNVDGTLHLAREAAAAGVERFIFISSIGVNGNFSTLSFNELDKPQPKEPYAISKYEAEQGLLKIAHETSMEVVIIRPPLVYGLRVKANFLSIIEWVNRRVPLPFGAINNQRSLVALDNLVSFIIHCIDHPKAANETFLISDGEDVSTTELLRKVAKAFGKKALLIPIPVWLMALVAKLVGKSDVANRLFGSLQIDSSKARKLLGWKPVITMDEQLKKIADEYLNEKNV